MTDDRTEGYQLVNNYFTQMCNGPEEGSYLRLVDSVYHLALGWRGAKKKEKKGQGFDLVRYGEERERGRQGGRDRERETEREREREREREKERERETSSSPPLNSLPRISPPPLALDPLPCLEPFDGRSSTPRVEVPRRSTQEGSSDAKRAPPAAAGECAATPVLGAHIKSQLASHN